MVMSTYSDMHMLLGDTIAVGIEGDGARVVLVEDGEFGRSHLALTFWNVPAVDRVMAALAEVRDNLSRPAGNVTTAGGGRS